MTSEDNTFDFTSLIYFSGVDFKELDRQLGITSEAQDDGKGPNHKRKKLSPRRMTESSTGAISDSCKMLSEDSTFKSLPSLNSADDYFAKELESQLQESDRVEVQDKKNGPNNSKKKLSLRRMIGSSTGAKSGANRPRKRQAGDELTEAKGKSPKKWRPTAPTFDVGEPSELKRKEYSVKELILIKKKSVAEVLKILWDRVYRRIQNDLKADWASCIFLMHFVMENQISGLYLPIVRSLDKIKTQWPVRSDLDNIRQKIKEMQKEEKDKEKLPVQDQDEMTMEVSDEKIRRLEELEQKIKRSDEKRQKDSRKANNVVEIFTTMEVSVETQREELSSAFPWLFCEEIATNEPASDQVQASLQTRKWFNVKDMEELEKKVFDEDNYRVEFSHFLGLQDEVNAAKGNIPDYLKSTANRIEDARNETTIGPYRDMLVLVSAAVKEMEDLAVDELDCPTLCKWGATCNLAKRMQFEVKFVENLLKKNMHAYLSYSRLKAGSEIRG